MRARNFVLQMLLLAVFSALAQAQVVVTDDANTSSFFPTTNFGTSVALIVCSGSNTYIKFSTANLGSGVTASNVSKATLTLYVDAVLTSGTMDVYQVNGSWSEGKVTYNSAPALGTKLFSAVSVSSTGYLSLDMTSTVQAWLNNTLANNGIALVPSSGSKISVSFDSKENIFTSHNAQLNLVLVSAGPQGPQGPQGQQGPQGLTGAAGPQGAAGPAGPAGATGLTGPAGQQGPQGLMGLTGTTGATGAAGPAGPAGANGTGFNFRNAFDNSASYAVNDVVTFQGASYVATAANQGPNNPTPDQNPSAWSVIAAQGAFGSAGAQGPSGPVGPAGPQGPSGPQGPIGPQGPPGIGSVPSGSIILGTSSSAPPNYTAIASGLSIPAVNGWSTAQSLSFPGIDSAVVVNGSIYVFGPVVSQSLSSGIQTTFNYGAYPFLYGSSIPGQVSLESVVSLNGKIYLIGGGLTSVTDQGICAVYLADSDLCGIFSVSSQVEIYDTATGVWSSGPALPTPVLGAAATVLNGLIYVIGGVTAYDPNAGLSYDTTDAVQIFDPVQNKWTSGPSVFGGAKSVSEAGAVTLNGKIYLVGGLAVNCCITTNLASNLNMVFDPTTNQWAALSPFPFANYFSPTGVATDGSVILAIAGGSPPPLGGGSPGVGVYNPSTGQWSTAYNLPPGPTWPSSIISTGPGLFQTFGGLIFNPDGSGSTTSAVLTFNVSQDKPAQSLYFYVAN